MKLEELNQKIENSAIAKRPIWLTLLCAFYAVALCFALIMVIFAWEQFTTLGIVKYRATIVIPCLLHIVGVVLLWRFSKYAAPFWGLAVFYSLLSVAYGPDRITTMLFPILFLLISIKFRKPKDDLNRIQ